MDSQLDVYLGDVHVGTLMQDEGGRLSFVYDTFYQGTPLSPTMKPGRIYGDKIVRPFLYGLLPDGYEVRRSLGRELGLSSDNPFEFLALMGLDCPGAVRVAPRGASIDRPGELIPLDDEAIAARLRESQNGSGAWQRDGEHWSLGGQQSKFAVRREGGAWYECRGGVATTHIFKPGIGGFEWQAYNEYLCLKLGRATGIPTPRVEFVRFDEERAVVVERYDRVRLADGSVSRIHQVDFCQILGVLPECKYPEEGGPGLNDMVRLVCESGSDAKENVRRMLAIWFFNYLVGAPDAHAKNYSCLLAGDRVVVAPMYDVASMLPYTDRPGAIKLAMGMMGENRTGRISRRRIERFVAFNDLERFAIDADDVTNMLVEMATNLPGAFAGVLEREDVPTGAEPMCETMGKGIDVLCSKSLSAI
jgi:serine/threonine-protein kinase HipA